jgi:hypothetical protein
MRVSRGTRALAWRVSVKSWGSLRSSEIVELGQRTSRGKRISPSGSSGHPEPRVRTRLRSMKDESRGIIEQQASMFDNAIKLLELDSRVAARRTPMPEIDALQGQKLLRIGRLVFLMVTKTSSLRLFTQLCFICTCCSRAADSVPPEDAPAVLALADAVQIVEVEIEGAVAEGAFAYSMRCHESCSYPPSCKLSSSVLCRMTLEPSEVSVFIPPEVESLVSTMTFVIMVDHSMKTKGNFLLACDRGIGNCNISISGGTAVKHALTKCSLAPESLNVHLFWDEEHVQIAWRVTRDEETQAVVAANGSSIRCGGA